MEQSDPTPVPVEPQPPAAPRARNWADLRRLHADGMRRGRAGAPDPAAADRAAARRP